MNTVSSIEGTAWWGGGGGKFLPPQAQESKGGQKEFLNEKNYIFFVKQILNF